MTNKQGLPENPPQALKVLVVDDHAQFRHSVASTLKSIENTAILEAEDGLDAVEKAKAFKPSIALMDLNMPRCGGLEATLRLQKEMPEVRVLILTVSDKEGDLFSALRFGARGYLLKDSSPQDIIQAVHQIASGDASFSPSMATKLLDEFKKQAAPRIQEPSPTEDLTTREKELLGFIATGQSNKEIASALFISENTVKTHLKNILEKLHARNRSEAAAYGIRLGIAR